MDKAAKAEKSIKHSCQQLGITDGGRLWLDTALDPFKDLVQKPIGYPDRNMAPSVVQTVHDSIDVSAPPGVTGNWDANIFLDALWRKTPLYTSQLTISNVRSCYNSLLQGTTPYTRGGLCVRAGASGTTLSLATTQNQFGLSYVTDVFADDTSSRIIGIGLEIHNTTSDLHKQGSLITYRVCDDPAKYPITATTGVTGGSLVQIPYEGIELVQPPDTAARAIDLPGSLQWDAAKGAYIVPVFTSEDNSSKDLRPLIPIDIDHTLNSFLVPKIIATANTVSFDSTIQDNATVPITLSGAFLTGLSLESTLTINLTYYIEQFPSVDSQLKRVAGPSCVEDFPAIELYTKVARQMPTGVEVNDNFLGAFVSGVSRLVSMAVPHIPKILNFASGVANAITPLMPVQEQTLQVTPVNRVREIVPSRSFTRPSQELTVYQPQRTPALARQPSSQPITIVTQQPMNQRRPNQTNKSRVRNRRNKDYDRLEKYIQAGKAGNRYIH